MSETGDRRAFLARVRERTALPVTTTGPHPPPEPPDQVPSPRFRALDGLNAADRDGLVDLFSNAARAVDATVHPRLDDEAVAQIVSTRGVRSAVLSTESLAQSMRGRLEACGVEVSDYSPTAGVQADLGVTTAVAAIAVTGSVVLDSSSCGGRAVSLTPRVHLCLVPVARIVPAPGDVLRRGDVLPSARVIVTGPSRTGDIEQIITLGAHGPVAVELVLVD